MSKKVISSVVLNPLFEQISTEFGYSFEEYKEDVLELVELWESDGFVELYVNHEDRAYGKAKPSDAGSEPGTIPYLIGLYHVRLLKKENDPLVIITFDDDESESEVAHLRFIINHDLMFGAFHDKYNPEALKSLKRAVSDAIERGTATD